MRHVFHRSFYLVLSLAALASAAQAQSALDSNSVSGSSALPESVTVTATRIATPVEQVASSVTVITAADIAAQDQQTLPQILENLPGLNVVQTGGPGGITSVFMRGTNSNHVKVLVDGIDVSDPSASGDAFDFGQYLSGDVARVEVLRGPQSGLYGSDAIGGVINVITKTGAGPLQFNESSEGGSFDTFNQSASVSGLGSGFSYFAGVQHLHVGATAVTPTDILAPGETRNPDYDDNLTMSTKLGYEVTDNFDLGFVGRFTGTLLKNTGTDFLGFPETERTDNTTNGYYSRGTAHLVMFDGVLDQTLGFDFTHNHTNANDPLEGLNSYAGQRAKLDYQGNIALVEGQVLVIGADHERESVTIPISAATTTDSGFAELQSSLGDFNNAANVRYDSNERFGGHATFRIAPTYLIEATGTRLKASVGTGFKAPTIADLFQNFPSFGFFANPNLKPETSTGYDGGFEQALGANTSFGATFYYNNIKNLIDDNSTFTSLTNVGKAITQGVEAYAQTKFIDDLTLRADYTYTDAHDMVLNEALLRRPKHKVTLDARWQAMEQLSLDANLTYVSSWVDGNRSFTISRLNAPGYTLANLSASYELNENLTIDGQITNLLDQHYQNPTGFLAPSLGWYLGVKVKE